MNPDAQGAQVIPPAVDEWWRSAVVYEIYPRSFADSDGDGVGDIAGMTSRLEYLRDLGADAVWITPWYSTPMADGGYDVADFRSIAPDLGALCDAEGFIAAAHRLGLRVLLDLVPNHTSIAHEWFRTAVARGPASEAADRYWIRPGRGPRGQLPPNDWRSVFGGPAWSPFPSLSEAAGSGHQHWYLHLFAPEQPDLNWTSMQVRDEFDSILRFWFDRGADGFRVDVAHGLAKDPDLPDLGTDVAAGPGLDPAEVAGVSVGAHPHWDRAEVHDVFRHWRTVADAYTPARVFVAEAWRIRAGGLAHYVRSDELHTAFNFDLLGARWDPGDVWSRVSSHLDLVGSVGAPATWVLGSHDITRVATRMARDTHWTIPRLGRAPVPGDGRRGLRRARALVLMVLALPGSVYVYQGDELGLPEVEDLPTDALTDPIWARSGHQVRGRDGCRVPLPWTPDRPGFGFTEAAPWLPVPANWGGLSVGSQLEDPHSTLALYRMAIRLRRRAALGSDLPALNRAPSGARAALAFDRGQGFRCVVNFSETDSVDLPEHATVLVASSAIADHCLPPESACWLSLENRS